MADRQTKAQTAYRGIRKLLIGGRLPHDTRLSLRALARQLKMSVVPISEAVRKLEQEGLLVTQPQSGIYLRRLNPSEKRQMNLLRQALEVQAARLVALRQPEKDLKALTKLAVTIAKQSKQNRPDLAANSDLKFHARLVSAAQIPMLSKQYERISAVAMVCGMDLPLNSWHEDSPGHTDIIEALETAKPDKAAKAVLKHIRAEDVFLKGNSK